MHAEVIDWVHVLACCTDSGLTFSDCHGNPFISNNDIEYDGDDESYHPDENDNIDGNIDLDNDTNNNDPNMGHPNSPNVNIAGVCETKYKDENENEGADEPGEDQSANENENDRANELDEDQVANEPNDDADREYKNKNATLDNNENDSAKEQADNDKEEENQSTVGEHDIEHEMNAKYGARTGTYDLRAQQPQDYSHLHATLESIDMMQHNMKKGIKLFGKARVDAVFKELKQLHDRKVLEPKDTTTMIYNDKQAALQYLMFLKQKRNETIKGRGCADSQKQHEYTAKEDASSPTVAIELVLLTSMIDVKENRDVATANIPGAFMQADMDNIVHMKLKGKMAELLVKVDPKMYRKYVQMEKGKTVLYMELKKALYGSLKVALLFWRKLTAELKKWCFMVNPYDWCVMNKIINGCKCTVLWHVDDLKGITKNFYSTLKLTLNCTCAQGMLAQFSCRNRTHGHQPEAWFQSGATCCCDLIWESRSATQAS